MKASHIKRLFEIFRKQIFQFLTANEQINKNNN